MRIIIGAPEELYAKIAAEFAAAAEKNPSGAFAFTAVDVPAGALEAIAASGAEFGSETFTMKLADITRKNAAEEFGSPDETPTHGVTMGISTLLAAKRILLITCGKEKANAAQKTIEGRPETFIPASFLQLHTDVTVFLDPDAASKL